MTFEQWKQQVNLLFLAEYGVDSDAFEDYLWRDEFSSGYTPGEAFAYWQDQQPFLA